MAQLSVHSFIRQPLLEAPEVYHGGPKGITVFKVDKTLSGNEDNPAGVYVTTKKDYSKGFANPTVYTLYIPDTDLVFIKWEFRYTAQPPKVQEKLKQVCEHLGISDYESLGGRSIYNLVRKAAFGGKYKESITEYRKTSKYLAAAGIDGVVFEHMPYGAGRVYCIFNTKIIEHRSVETLK